MLSFNGINRLLVWGIKAALFLIPVLPLYVSTSMVFPYITGKNFAFRILVEFAAALWLVLIRINKEYRLRNSPMLLSILTFTFIVGLADLLGASPYNSFWSNYERMEGYITILHLAVYFMVMSSVLKSRRDWVVLFNIIAVVSALASLYALSAPPPEGSQFAVIYGLRAYGTLGNPPFLASYLLLSVFVAVLLIWETKRRFLRLAYLLIIFLNLIAIYYSASRGAILGALTGALLFGLFYAIQKADPIRKKLGKKALLSAMGGIIVLSILTFSMRNADFVKNDRTLSRFATMFSDPSVQNRFSVWKMAWNGIKERPLLGWGQENFIGVYTVNTIPFNNDQQLWLDRAHNIIIDWLVNAGILGLLSYLAIFAVTFYVLASLMKNKKISPNAALTYSTALIAYFIQNLFTFDTISTYLLLFVLLSYLESTDNVIRDDTSGSRGAAPSACPVIKTAGIISTALVVFSLSFYYLNYKPIEESRIYLRITKSTSKYSSFDEMLKDAEKALSLKTFGDILIAQGMRTISFQIARFDKFDDKGAQDFVAKTVEVLERGASVLSQDLDYLTNMIIFYKEAALHEPAFMAKAEALIKEGLRLNPEYQWLYMAMADISVLKKDYEGAYLNVKKIMEMDPQNDKKQLKFALAAILHQQKDMADMALEKIRKIREANATLAYGDESVFSFYELVQLASTYSDAGNYERALFFYERALAILPAAKKAYELLPRQKLRDEASVRFEAAVLYALAGDKDKAAKEASQAAELLPQYYAKKAEQLIYEINK